MVRSLVALSVCLSWAVAALASIHESKQLKIDFRDVADAKAKAVWSTPDKLKVAPEGLGWNGEVASSRDRSFRTKPLAVGMSWRAPYGANVER